MTPDWLRRVPPCSRTGTSPISLMFARYPAVRVSPLKKSTKRGSHFAPQSWSISATLNALPDWAKQYNLNSVIVTGNERAAPADEEIEIRALARLVDVVEVEAPIAALERRLGRFPFLLPARDFVLGHEK